MLCKQNNCEIQSSNCCYCCCKAKLFFCIVFITIFSYFHALAGYSKIIKSEESKRITYFAEKCQQFDLMAQEKKKMHDKDMKHSDKMYAHKDILNNENVYLTSHHFPSNAKRGQNEKLENIKVECEGMGEE